MRSFFTTTGIHCILFQVVLLIISAKASTQNLILEKLPPFVNSDYDEISPVPTRDGRRLYFTRVAYPVYNQTLLIDSTDRAKEETPDIFMQTLSDVYSQIAGYYIPNPAGSAFNQDVWELELPDSNEMNYNLIHPPYPLNNALPNSLVAITPDPKRFYIINQFMKNGNMDRGFSEIVRQNDSTWNFPEPVTIEDYYTITSDVSLTMSFDGQVLILSATRFDSRDMDLYVCFRTGQRNWSAPVSLGKQINSEKRETTPFLSEDNTTLFFSSNRWQSAGGNDIFMSRRLDSSWTNWSEPMRLKEPINSNYDESQPYFNMTSGHLYFTSKRSGNSDIYRIQIAPPQPTEIKIIGRILNGQTNELITNARVRYSAENTQGNYIESSDGTFTLTIPKGVPFDLIASKSGFIGKSQTILFRRDYYYFRERYIDLYIDPIKANETITLKPIYFQQSKAIILENSFSELERLSDILLENPGMEIQIEGHTDNLGNPEALVALSVQRAEAIKEFLVKKGISPERILTVGYGAQFPINDNTSDERRAQNRRTEFRILKI